MNIYSYVKWRANLTYEYLRYRLPLRDLIHLQAIHTVKILRGYYLRRLDVRGIKLFGAHNGEVAEITHNVLMHYIYK